MAQKPGSIDQLYLNAETLSEDFSLFPRKGPAAPLKGLLSEQQVNIQLQQLQTMEVDEYIAATVLPSEESTRPGARQVIEALELPISHEERLGPYFACEVELEFDGSPRTIGLIAQDRAFGSGVWGPEHHQAAADRAIGFAIRSLPIVTFMDTPGADPYEQANAANQAHSISRLIAELCNVDVPTVGIIVGQGYSGGAIPLAASNLLLSLRTGVFNTIHPRSLASLVTRYNLSWQECAKFVGVSSFELYRQGNIDGIVDYDPGETENIQNLRDVIVAAISSIEEGARQFVGEHPEILDHYHRNINRYLNVSEYLAAVNASSSLKLRTSPTEYPNVFGVAYRYLRYLGLRSRIKATTTTQYGRLANVEIPPGELAQRVHRERRAAFLNWLQDPDKVLYDDALNKVWKNFVEKRERLGDEQGALRKLIFGEPEKNYEKARQELCMVAGLHLFNRWKGNAKDNLLALIEHLNEYESSNYLLATEEIKEVKTLLVSMSECDESFVQHLKSLFSFDGRKLFDPAFIDQKKPDFLRAQLASELNLILEQEDLFDESRLSGISLSPQTRALVKDKSSSRSMIPLNRRLLEDSLWSHLHRTSGESQGSTGQDLTILEVLLDPDVNIHFLQECRNLVVFSTTYDVLLRELVAIAQEAHDSRHLSGEMLEKLLAQAVSQVALMPLFADIRPAEINSEFALWVEQLGQYFGGSVFLKAVEEWMRVVHKDKSDTLFVVISHVFEKVLPDYHNANRHGRPFKGKLEPVRIGRRKDFWNRLTIAYRDLLFNELLTREKRSKKTRFETLLERYVSGFEETSANLMSANPVSFPTFRPSIESALKNDIRPHGLITGIGDFNTSESSYRVGLVMSNVAFQAGSIDNSDCVRFCKLLVECASQRLPVVCFISSGGMQTKEGAAALFTMAVINDRITRFVRDNDLPIILFGYGDCTGGAQASFVTHPLAQTYYFSGCSMPFAGQAVVERNLPYTCMMSNYLSMTPGAMQGLVKHPFATDLEQELRRVDPAIPVPTETIEAVVDRIMSGVLTAIEPSVGSPELSEDELIRPVEKVLIHARGCTAVKLVSKALELNYHPVLVQSDPDMDSVAADLVGTDGTRGTLVCIGGNTSDESYLNALSILKIAENEGVDSLHPGIGFLSESPNFAGLVRQKGINFIGPRVSSMETMGNKSNAINTTLSINVPVVPGSHGIVESSEIAAEFADQVGYPILLKAVHGGGGKGIVKVERPENLHQLYHQVTMEARNAFGNGDTYIEKCVTSLRHIEAQILRDTQGNTRVIGIRDCSVQRNNQKLMEESGSTLLSKALRDEVIECAARIADAVDYIGAGTVEFIYDVPSNAIYFMEMNTRLQVEHPVTEAVTGIDIVKQQFAIASGQSLESVEYQESGYALEVRINAEKASLEADGNVTFIPTPGLMTVCDLPQQDDIKLISMAGEGKTVSPFYDSLIVQVIAHGTDREDTVARMRAYLDRININGICTNISLIKRVLHDEVFLSGDYDTTFLTDFLSRTDVPSLIEEIEIASGASAEVIDLDMLRIENSQELKVLSPSTGVFFRTPSPSEPEYVSVGDQVTVEDTLCVLEAMKMFTSCSLNSFSTGQGELYSSMTQYRVNRINVSNGQQVNEGDLLFVIQPVEVESSAGL
ncbi:MAG: ATP-grasp domain-containing protein [Gammaproteobacteria bacterium]|nr:ATP-grasp domain-containing protein [Gammaproteobacteria bacterium]